MGIKAAPKKPRPVKAEVEAQEEVQFQAPYSGSNKGNSHICLPPK